MRADRVVGPYKIFGDLSLEPVGADIIRPRKLAGIPKRADVGIGPCKVFGKPPEML